MKQILPAILLFTIAFFHKNVAAQDTSAKTLLWRISGTGLQKPSYLYGTMHLKDRRLFFFGDSVYKSLETSEGFAMEVDPGEMMDSIFSKLGDSDTTTLLRKLLDEKKFKSVSKKLEKKFGMPAGKITRKQLIAERESWYSNIHKRDDMKAIVDLYLYEIARKQGKLVGGIEDINDQFGIKDELGKDINIAEYVDDNDDHKKKEYLDKMVSLYTAGDIDKIDELMTGSQTKENLDLVLVNRNIKMAKRMDSLAHIRNSFFAVGAAHLPGKTGLITLLKNKGFTVTPVFSSKKLAPEKYTYTVNETPWIKFVQEDSAYMVEMPGKGSDLKMMNDEIKFKIYADLASGTFYMTGFSFLSNDESREASMERMTKYYSSGGFQKKENKKISNKGIDGIEFLSVKDNIFYRMQIFSVANKVFMVMAGGENKEGLYTKDVEKFLLSFTMNPLVEAKPNSWVNYADTLKAFNVAFPKKPGIDKLKAGETDENIETSTYTAIDLSSLTYYVVGVNDAKRGYIISDDTLIFNAKLNYYKQLNSVISDIRKFDYEGNSAMSFTAETKQEDIDYTTKMLVICRGNRSYSVAAITKKGKEDFPDISRFFRSFRLMPYKESVWSVQNAHDKAYSTWAPSSFYPSQPDTVGLSGEDLQYKLLESEKSIQLVAHDPNASTSYNVNIYPVSKYYWAENDSSFFADQMETYYSDTSSDYARSNPGMFDSLIYKKNVTNGKVKGVEIVVKSGGKLYYKRVRVLPHGDSTYHLFVLAPYEYLTNENNNKYFNKFRFSDENLPSTIFKNKAAVILNDLAGTDSASKAEAITAINYAKFGVTDLPLLFSAYLKQYPADSTMYGTINEKIGLTIKSVHDSSTVTFIKENYLAGTVKLPALKFNMLALLASQRTTSAILVLKDLLLKAPPKEGQPFSLINELSDSVSLSRQLFPEAGKLFGDSLLGGGMLRLATELIDSNKMQKSVLQDNFEGILHLTKAYLAQLKKDKDDYPFYNQYLIDALGKINNQQSINLLNEFVKIANLWIKQNAVLALLKNNQAVPVSEIRKLAADVEYRVPFYKSLKEIGKSNLFPADFLTKQQFAQGYVYSYASENGDVKLDCKFVGERTATVKGVIRKFYLFNVLFDYDGETEEHLAICGRFDISSKNVELKDDDLVVRIFYDREYSASTLDNLFKEFIKEEKEQVNTSIK